jgi:hypothetical protein
MLLKCLAWLLVMLIGLLVSPQPALADAIPTTEVSVRPGQAVVVPDLDQFSLADLPPFSESGGFREGPYQRTWRVGQTIDQVLTFSDLQDLAPGNLTLSEVGTVLGQDLGGRSIQDFPLLGNQSINDLMAAIPTLGSFDLEVLPPIAALVDAELGERLGRGQTLFDAVQRWPELGEFVLDDIDLSAFRINQIPGIAQTALGTLNGFEQATLNQVPGLRDLPLSSFPNPVAAVGTMTMQIDMIWGPREGNRPRTLSGSEQQGFAVPCHIDRQDCASIELQAIGPETNPLDGIHWVSGKYQEVEGGSGVLRGVNGGMEPTGRHPFGPAFKQVIWEPEERDDTVTSAIFFRACGWGGCTPYVIGPFPFITYRINDPIFVGLLDSDTPSATPSQRTGATRGGAMPGPGNTRLGHAGRLEGFSPDCIELPEGADPAEFTSNRNVAGIDVGTLASAIASIESQGSGGYFAVGPHVCADGGRNCGRGLGKFQFMRYNDQAAQLIAARPGGTAFLSRVGGGHSPSTDELMRYFPPEDQNRAFEGFLASNLRQASGQIDPITGRPFAGGRLVERAAQMHFGGPGVPIDGGGSDAFGRLSVRAYGERARQVYEQGGGSVGGLNLCPAGTPVAVGGPEGDLPAAGDINGAIHRSMMAMGQFSSRDGPDGGNLACAWAVNRVLENAGIVSLGGDAPNWVPAVEADLQNNRGIPIDRSQGQAGDIVISGGQEHIGICLNDGCTQVRSNSSSRAAFTWDSDTDFGGFYGSGPSRLYRITEARG